jgi:hypothetical protein
MTAEQESLIIKSMGLGATWRLAASSAGVSLDDLREALDESARFSALCIEARRKVVHRALGATLASMEGRRLGADEHGNGGRRPGLAAAERIMDRLSEDDDPRLVAGQGLIDLDDCETTGDFMAAVRSALGAE